MNGSKHVDGRPLAPLMERLQHNEHAGNVRDAAVAGIQTDSRRVGEADLFVALRGQRVDGHDYIGEAVRRGAAAVVADRDAPDAPVPVVRVRDSRRALAVLAAEWYGRPADRVPLVGITGSLGKTSVLMMLRAILAEAGLSAGVIGSLGAHFDGHVEPTHFTTPDPLKLHGALARMVGRGARIVLMEATSHALAQRRVHGLRFSLGIFTNLVLLEHTDYHGGFREYVEAKARFLDQLPPGAPLVYSAGDRALRGLLEGRDVQRVGCGAGAHACVRSDERAIHTTGTRLRLRVRRPLPAVPGVDEPAVVRARSSAPRPLPAVPRAEDPAAVRRDRGRREPVDFPLHLRLLGRPNALNATLAVAAGLCLGVPVAAARRAISAFPPPPRRMQLIRCGHFTLLDDTVGHPDSITAVFEVASRLPHHGLRTAYAVRGQRGVEINRRDAEALAIWTRRLPSERVLITSSADATNAANRVAPAERDAFLDTLRRHHVAFEYRERLRDTADEVVRDATPGDLILLLGAQGMNRGAAAVRRCVDEKLPGR